MKTNMQPYGSYLLYVRKEKFKLEVGMKYEREINGRTNAWGNS